MSANKFKKFTGIIIAQVLVLIAGTGAIQITGAAVGNTVSGVQCMPASLKQAFGKISWDHMRVQNSHTSPLWVVCSGLNDQSSDGTDIWYTTKGSHQVTAWFGSSSASGAAVFCIARSVLGGASNTTGLSASTSITADGALPDTRALTVISVNLNTFAPITMTCRLDPGTGLQGITAFASKS